MFGRGKENDKYTTNYINWLGTCIRNGISTLITHELLNNWRSCQEPCFFCFSGVLYIVVIMEDLMGCPVVSFTQLSSCFLFHRVIISRKKTLLSDTAGFRLISHKDSCWIGTQEVSSQQCLMEKVNKSPSLSKLTNQYKAKKTTIGWKSKKKLFPKYHMKIVKFA